MSKSTASNSDALPKSVINIAWILVLGAMAPMLDSTMVNIAINNLTHDFNTSLATVQWAITGFTIAMGIAVPFSSWLTNHFSGKSVYLAAEVAFGLTSLLSGIAWNIQALIGFRILQGFAAGLIMPLLMTLIVDSVGGDKLGRIMAIVGMPMTLGPMLGPIIGGILVQYASWRAIFYINIPVVIIAAYFIYKYIPEIKPKNINAKLDWFGVAFLAIAASTIVYGVVKASSMSTFNNTTTLTYVLIGLAFIFAYIYHAWKQPQIAVLPLNLFKHLNFSGSMLGMFLMGFVTTGPMILLPLYFQDIKGNSVIIAALALVPQSVGMLIARGSVGKLTDRFGARWIVIISVLITIIGTVPFMYFDAQSSYWLVAIVLFIRGAGGAGIMQPMMTDAYVGIDKSESGAASIGTRMLQQVGGGFGSAFLSTVVAAYIANHHVTTIAHLANAYQRGFTWSAILVVVLIIPALMLTNKISLKK